MSDSDDDTVPLHLSDVGEGDASGEEADDDELVLLSRLENKLVDDSAAESDHDVSEHDEEFELSGRSAPLNEPDPDQAEAADLSLTPFESDHERVQPAVRARTHRIVLSDDDTAEIDEEEIPATIPATPPDSPLLGGGSVYDYHSVRGDEAELSPFLAGRTLTGSRLWFFGSSWQYFGHRRPHLGRTQAR